MIGLHRAHREAVDGSEALHAEMLGHEAMLGAHIVGERHERGVARRLGRARGKPVREHVGDDDAPTRGIENLILADEPGHVLMLRAVARRIKDEVVARAVQRAVALPDELAVMDRAALLGDKIAELEFARLLR